MTRSHTSFLRRGLVTGAIAAASLLSAQASACGGFFCSTSAPVDQTAERIIFSKDANDNVTQIVEVLYEGDAEKFAWVLPVPGTPEPGVSAKEVFDRVQSQTQPQYQFNDTRPNNCPDMTLPPSAEFGGEADPSDAGAISASPITVLDSGSVGPFDYETISVDAEAGDPAEVAVTWLQDNGYDVDARTADVLGPYLANGLNLIAFRLQKGESAGAIRPISLEYQASTLSIPIRPTAVSAADDMPILVWVLSEHRAVPTNYKSLVLNDLLIDWFNPRSNYDSVVTAAADESGGQGFVTEFAGAPDGIGESIWRGERASAILEDQEGSNIQSQLEALIRQYGRAEGFREVVDEHVPLRDGISVEDFFNCTQCYFNPARRDAAFGGFEAQTAIDDQTDPIFTIDMSAVAAAIDEDIVKPMEQAAQLFKDADYMTRLYTTMSSNDMDMDPTFKLNPDLEDVSNIHTVDREVDCKNENWKVTFPTGEVVYGSGRTWPYNDNATEMPANRAILALSTSGEGDVITDNTEFIFDLHGTNTFSSGTDPVGDDGSANDFTNGGGLCSASRNPSQGSLWTFLALGLGAGLGMRRRSLRRN